MPPYVYRRREDQGIVGFSGEIRLGPCQVEHFDLIPFRVEVISSVSRNPPGLPFPSGIQNADSFHRGLLSGPATFRCRILSALRGILIPAPESEPSLLL